MATASVAAAQEEFEISRLPALDLEGPAQKEPVVEPSPMPPPAEEIPAGEAEAGWYSPSYWIYPVYWDGSIEFGLTGSEGNSSTLNFKAGANLKRKTAWNEIELDIKYYRATNESVQTQHNALFQADVNWLLEDSPWSLFHKTAVEYDEFKAFDYRLSLSLGVGYQAVQTDIASLKYRSGSGASREFAGPDDDWVPEAVLGFDYKYQFTPRQSFKAKVDYMPDWTDFADYRMVTDVGYVILLNEAHNLNLKLGLVDRFDSTPNGRKANDIDYSVVLLWKL